VARSQGRHRTGAQSPTNGSPTSTEIGSATTDPETVEYKIALPNGYEYAAFTPMPRVSIRSASISI
jgi:hypothetical protein